MSEEKTVPMWRLKLKCKAKTAADKVKQTGKKLKDWAVKNPEKALAVIGGIGSIGGSAYKFKRSHDEHVRLHRRFYDRRTDSYSWSKRDLTPREQDELERRYRNGERKKAILMEMGLLKY